MLTNATASARIAQLQGAIASQMPACSIRDRKARIAVLQDRWERLQRVISERAADPNMAGVPGGRTGLILVRVRRVGRGKDVTVRQYEVDTRTLAEIRAIEEQAARELGHWSEKHAHSGSLDIVGRLAAGRRRMIEQQHND